MLYNNALMFSLTVFLIAMEDEERKAKEKIRECLEEPICSSWSGKQFVSRKTKSEIENHDCFFDEVANRS